jgi:hypothetical protein
MGASMSPPRKPLDPKDTVPDVEDDEDDDWDEDVGAVTEGDDEPTLVKKRER